MTGAAGSSAAGDSFPLPFSAASGEGERDGDDSGTTAGVADFAFLTISRGLSEKWKCVFSNLVPPRTAFSAMELVELGILVIVVLKARDLKDPHSFSNPLATVSLSNNSVAFSSPVDPRGGQTPVWDYECRFTVWQSLGNPALITISVYSDAEEEDRKLGTAQVSLENWPANESANANEFDAWVQLVDQGKPAGEVFLEMTF